MADKEATVYIIDVAKSMGKRRHGRTISDLEWAMEYVWDRITKTVRCHFKEFPLLIPTHSSYKVATGRKTATVGVVGLRTDGRGHVTLLFNLSTHGCIETSNDIKNDDSYSHISVFQGIGQYGPPHLRLFPLGSGCAGFLCPTCGGYVRSLNPATLMLAMVRLFL